MNLQWFRHKRNKSVITWLFLIYVNNIVYNRIQSCLHAVITLCVHMCIHVNSFVNSKYTNSKLVNILVYK